IALTHPLTGALLALTDAATLRTGGRAGPPPETPGYRPGAALAAFVRARDRRCRFPGCRARPSRCDLDHQLPHARGGPTAHANLCCLCEHHHRLSHQAPGWSMRPMPDGAIAWTLPGGTQVITHPPAYGTDDDLPSSQPPPEPDDPPPF
ncbi:HNH endonuclease, partial [Geodermatophilus ruber]